LRFADLPSSTMGDQRDVYVFLPRAYDLDPGSDRPLMIVHDGNESIVRSQFDQVADAEMEAGRVAPVVLAFVALPSQEQRIDEYTFHTATSRGELYRTFICDELVPALRAEFRLDPDPQQTAVFGASLGGLISYFIGWERSEVFGLVAGMSSSFFWDDNWMVVQVQTDSGPLRPLRFYLDSADVNDNHDETVLVDQALTARGYPHLHVVQVGASHDWFYWKQRFDGMLQYLYPQNLPPPF
jgi:iron(III)-enterobactin esterase